MNSILQKIKLGPRVTLNQLLNQTKNDKIVQSSNIYNKSFKFNTKQGIQVNEPFYIDRFKHGLHEHSQQKCLACQYAKLKQFQLQYRKKDNFSNNTKLNKQNCFPIRTQRNSQQNIPKMLKPDNKRYRASVGAEEQQQANLEILQKCIQKKLKQLDQNFKQKFKKQIKKDCDSIEIIKKFTHYLLNSNRNCGVWSIIKNIETLDIKKEIRKQSFINTIKNQYIPRLIYSNLAKKEFNGDIKNNQNATKQPNEKANLKTQKLLQPQPKVKNIKGRQKVMETINKKAKILQTEEENLQKQSETQSICSSYLNNIQNPLTVEVKDQLSKVARKKYKKFKKVIKSMDNLIHLKLEQDPTIREQISKKVQMAADWMKSSILHNDKFEQNKNKRLDKLIKSVKENKSGQIRKSISNIPNDKSHVLSKFNNQQQQQNSDNSSSISERNNNIKKNQKAQNSTESYKKSIKIKNQKNSKLSNRFKISLNKQAKIQEHTEKLIQQKQLQKNNQQQIVHVLKKSDMKSRKSKISFLKHQKLQNQQYFFQEQEQQQKKKKEQQIVQVSSKPNKNFCDNCQQSIKYSIKYSQKVNQKMSLQNKQPQKVQHEHRRKLLRRIKAAQLLKHNQQLILNVQNCLRQLNLSSCIINQSDCVLTQKKKIRFLRQLTRIRSMSRDLQQIKINQILQYLLVYQQNCQILIQKYTNQQHIQNQDLIQIKNILSRQGLKNKLLFYQLSNDKVEQEDQQDIPFIHNLYDLGNKQIDLSIQQQKKQQQPQKLNIKIKRQRNKDRKYTELLQRQMSDKVQTQSNLLEYLS